MRRERFQRLVAEALDSLPGEFRRQMKNVAVLVEDVPREQRERRRRKLPRPRSSPPATLVLGHYIGTPLTERSVFALPAGPDRISWGELPGRSTAARGIFRRTNL